MSIKTKYLVRGEEPNEKDTAAIEGFTKISEEAQTLGIRTISLHDFLDYLGYKVEDRTVRLGPNANPKDFKPRLPAGVQRVRPAPKKKRIVPPPPAARRLTALPAHPSARRPAATATLLSRYIDADGAPEVDRALHDRACQQIRRSQVSADDPFLLRMLRSEPRDRGDNSLDEHAREQQVRLNDDPRALERAASVSATSSGGSAIAMNAARAEPKCAEPTCAALRRSSTNRSISSRRSRHDFPALPTPAAVRALSTGPRPTIASS